MEAVSVCSDAAATALVCCDGSNLIIDNRAASLMHFRAAAENFFRLMA
jgi:hypothetical protein